MNKFQVDCPTFLRLANVSLGEIGSYRVSADGVVARMTEEHVEDSQAPALESAELLEFIRDARLPLPTTSDALLSWMRKNDELGLLFPEWFVCVVGSADAKEAHVILSETAAKIDAELSRFERESLRAGEPFGKGAASARCQTGLSLFELRAEREAITSIQALLPVTSAAITRAIKATDAKHVRNRAARRQAIELYKSGEFGPNKTQAAEKIAQRVALSPRTVRKALQGQ